MSSVTSRHRITFVCLAATLLIGSLSTLCGCGGGDEAKAEVTDPQLVLAQFDESRKRHDPVRFVEVELGEFFTTKRLDENQIITISFTLYGVVPEEQRDEMMEKKNRFEKRMRDAVLTEIGKAKIEDLTEPHMGLLRSRLLKVIHRATHTRILRNVVFSSFAMEQA